MQVHDQHQSSGLNVEHGTDTTKKAWHSLSLMTLAVPSETLGGDGPGNEDIDLVPADS